MQRILVSAALSAALPLTTLGASAPSHAVPTQPGRVTIDVMNEVPFVGEKIEFRGRVAPFGADGPVRLQVRRPAGRGWKTVTTRRAHGRDYVLKARVRKPGDRTYRVRVPGTDRHGPAISKRVHVTAYEWSALTEFTPVEALGMAEVPEAHMWGFTYVDSVITTGGDGFHSTAYRLRGDCLELSVTMNLDASSQPGGQGTWQVYGDGALLQPVATNLYDVSGIDKIWFTATTSGGGVVAFGSPRVTCSF